ncbi:hypothetical protein [Microbulbifer sp. TYP-18]|uniref:hypothetical protein n=1 Tax=Microbulbifer sp. TYP-18 TaxID=3230024 RepID=UPI0034C6B996
MRVIAILFSLAVAGCASQANINSWQGASLSELVMEFGTPTGETTLESGRMIEFERTVFIDGTSYTCYRRYLLNEAGRVIEERLSGSCS